MNAKTEIDRLVKQAYDPKYATKGAIGSLSDNWNAAKRWYRGDEPEKIVRTGGFMTSSISAPTIVDRFRGLLRGIRGEDPYGHRISGRRVSAREFDGYIDSLPWFVLNGNEGNIVRVPGYGDVLEGKGGAGEDKLIRKYQASQAARKGLSGT